jgi:hypothetical protein
LAKLLLMAVVSDLKDEMSELPLESEEVVQMQI